MLQSPTLQAVGGVVAKHTHRHSEDVNKDTEGGGDNTNNGGKEKDNVDCKSLISEEQVDVGLQISSALMYLHEMGIMFRDLKPQNIGFDGE